MQNQREIYFSSPETHDRFTWWNDLLVQAAKDLATFTEYGIYARFIASLAQKVEKYELLSRQNKLTERRCRLEKEIEAGMAHICQTARKIWQESPANIRFYNRRYDQQAQSYSMLN